MSAIAPGSLVATGAVGSTGEPPNLLVHGDCLAALGALVHDPAYAGDVRLAYVDPPFNTGERFADFDDAMDRRAWLEGMEERLAATWPLLRADGALRVHATTPSRRRCGR